MENTSILYKIDWRSLLHWKMHCRRATGCHFVPRFHFLFFLMWYHDLLYIKVPTNLLSAFPTPFEPRFPLFRPPMNTDNALDMILQSSFCWKSMDATAMRYVAYIKVMIQGRGIQGESSSPASSWGSGSERELLDSDAWDVVYVCVTHHAAAKLQISLRWYFATFTNVLVPPNVPVCVSVCVWGVVGVPLSVCYVMCMYVLVCVVFRAVCLRLWLAFQAYLTFMLDVSVAADIRIYEW